MNLESAPFLRSSRSSPLSARLSELTLFMSAPLAGRLTDEQRSLCLAIARRLVMSVAQRIDRNIDLNKLWSDWLETGLPHHDELILACLSRAEEHRWRSASEYSEPVQNIGGLGMPDEPELAMPWTLPNEKLRLAYMDLQLADRRRFDTHGYPALAIGDVSEDVYRHLLNEIARWRLSQVSRDRHSAAGLGDAVRHAWRQRTDDEGIDEAAAKLYLLLRDGDLLKNQVSEAAFRQDWPCFIALTAAAQERTFSDMAMFWLISSDGDRRQYLSELAIGVEVEAAVAASLSMLPSRIVGAATIL